MHVLSFLVIVVASRRDPLMQWLLNLVSLYKVVKQIFMR